MLLACIVDLGLYIWVLACSSAGEAGGLKAKKVLVCLRLGDTAQTCVELNRGAEGTIPPWKNAAWTSCAGNCRVDGMLLK